MRAAIIGSRTIDDAQALANLLTPYQDQITEVISGGAIGVDHLAEQWARKHSKKLRVMYPEYKRYGKIAPLIRNEQIISSADQVFIVWDGTSKGTAHARKEAERQGRPVHETRAKSYLQRELF